MIAKKDSEKFRRNSYLRRMPDHRHALNQQVAVMRGSKKEKTEQTRISVSVLRVLGSCKFSEGRGDAPTAFGGGTTVGGGRDA